MISNWRASLAVVSFFVVLAAALPARAVTVQFKDGAVHDVTSAFTDPISVNDGGTPSQGTTVNMLAGSSVDTSASGGWTAFRVGGHSTANFFAGSSLFTPGPGFGSDAIDFGGPSCTVNLFGGTINGANRGIMASGVGATLNMYGGTVISRYGEGVNAIAGAVINIYGGEIDGTQSAMEANNPSARINLFGGVIFGVGNSRRLSAFDSGSIYIYGSDFRLNGTPVPYGLVTEPIPFPDQLTGTLSDGTPLNVVLSGGDFVLVPLGPAPEPATALLSGVALAGLGVQMLRRRRPGTV